MKLSLKVIPQSLFDGASQVVLVVKYLPANAGDKKKSPANAADVREACSVPGWGQCLGGGHGIHPSILAWRIPRTEELDRL